MGNERTNLLMQKWKKPIDRSLSLILALIHFPEKEMNDLEMGKHFIKWEMKAHEMKVHDTGDSLICVN